MPKQYLDDSGNPIAAPAKQYLDESGNPISAQSTAPAPRSAAKPEDRTLGNYISETVRGVGRGIKNDVVGLATTVNNPTAALADLYTQTKDAATEAAKEFRQTAPAPMGQRVAATALTGLENAPMIGGMVQHAEQGGTKPGSPESVGAAAEGVTTFEAPGAVAKLAPRALRAGDSMRAGVQSLVGAGEKPVKAIVAKEATQAGEAAKAAIKSNREATAAHATDTSEVKAANKEAVRAQSKIQPTQEKLKTAGRELQAQIETARKNALEEGNSKYTAVNEELNPVSADMEAVHGLFHEAAESFGEAQAQPALVTRLGKALEHQAELTYKDLQPIYSELGKELSKGSLPGTTYHAYDVMHEAIGNEMQRIADSKGQGAQLTSARNYWRRMKQTFGKPYNPTDAGNVTLEKATGQGVPEEQANRVRLLGSFDKTIPQTVEHIGNLRKGLDALPKEQPVRDVVKQLAPKPDLKQIHPTDVNTRAIRENLLDRWTAGESQLSKFQVRSLIGGGLGAIVGGLFEGKMGAGLGGVIGSALGPAAISRLVELPAVREWLTRPPAGELETLRNLPSADRLRITDTLQKVVDQSGKMGKPVNVSPKVAAVIAGTGALAPRRPEVHPTDAWASTGQQ